MKRFRLALAAAVMSPGLSAQAPATPPLASPEPSITISQLNPDTFELTYSIATFTSRDQIEGDLLLSAARLALAHDEQSFVLLAMPGERPDVHPPRRNPAFGAKYGHWQPHWNYLLPQLGWQPWHPEWGAAFWTSDVDPKTVHRFDVHAMIYLGKGVSPLDEEMQFNAKDVVRDLTRPWRNPYEHSAH